MLLGDENITIFLNTKGTLDDVDAEMKEFLAYIENTTDAFAEAASSSLVKQIHKRVTNVKQSKEMEVEFMTLLQRDRENLEEPAFDLKRIAIVNYGKRNNPLMCQLLFCIISRGEMGIPEQDPYGVFPFMAAICSK